MGILFIADNAGIGCAGWVLRTITAEISEVLEQEGHSELAEWLTSDTSPVELYKVLDVRDLTKDNQNAFINAITPAYVRSKERGPKDWNDPHWDGYIELFQNLSEQAELVKQGKTPKYLPYLKGVSEHNGTRQGPGWGENENA